ncbi:mannobiose 2-epimerase [Catalinimonas alkaloidigena]|uniref:Mannobiose 2-epimerase n=1 Tax=Catalinimonas alkaloidigena TaxID=1075417 RepID=A0A1G9R359_9BACT|nr:AGE family epimerase/isomerase [Catalinimonas alkaloidigena]SDM17716.1 mannobiose 2-epimerase [Catalinimonas alkaloidigena]
MVRLLFSVFLSITCALAAYAQSTSLNRDALADEMERSFKKELLSAWYPRTLDRQAGGFLSRFDYQWQPKGDQEKMIVTQARHVWLNAKIAQFYPNDPLALSAARHGVRFLREHLWDAEQGGFYWLVTRQGKPIPEATGELIKQAYGNAFGIYALAAFYEASHDPEALQFAQEAFRWLDQHAHDPESSGYFQFLQRDGTPLKAGYKNTPPKDQNSSIHLLEAFTELYHVWPDPTLRDRLHEMLVLIRDTITVEPGTLTLFSTADWQPVSYRDSSAAAQQANFYLDHVSFGHDVETAYLMLEASEALGLEHDTITLMAGKKMVDHALKNGWDQAVGGFYDGGYYYKDRPGITIVQDGKNWWSQAEGLNTLLLMGDQFPNDPMRYHAQFQKLWAYTRRYLIDHEHGGWYEGGLDKEPQRKMGDKAHIWKAAYHDGRALMNCITRLRNGD